MFNWFKKKEVEEIKLVANVDGSITINEYASMKRMWHPLYKTVIVTSHGDPVLVGTIYNGVYPSEITVSVNTYKFLIGSSKLSRKDKKDLWNKVDLASKKILNPQ